MHPAVVAVIVVGGVFVLWGGYEVGRRLLEDHEERRQYSEYVRRYQRDFEKRNISGDDDDDASSTLSDDDNNDSDTKKLNMWHRGYENLRQRRARRAGSSSKSSIKSSTRRSFYDHGDHEEGNLYHSAYELTEMEKSILDRRQRLQMEQAMLDEAERDLQRRRELLASRVNSVNGLDTTMVSNSTTSANSNDNNPFFRPPVVQELDHPRPNFDESMPPSFFFAPSQLTEVASPLPLPPRPASAASTASQQHTERSVVYDYHDHRSSASSSSNNSVVSSSSSSSHPSMYQSTGGLDASTAQLGPRIDTIQAPTNLTSADADWSDVASVSGNRSRAESDLSDEFSQLSMHSSNHGGVGSSNSVGRPSSVSGESSISYDMLSFTDYDDSRS
ncbi:hypothetical protein BDB00DRAFT_926734 [Zychaea mexicana]|uniref:uncharacterized protein n=1 Tax=Zychaea mexicana TaxID=64656 RepID=UPI0022FE2E41|nr:uncharacterized protein BDB00DRAFT_926734 [Zychaea mexicana]KAI9496530.1 hypothetical protein BDB00DRAFT_926734 [Zychaea mexicana]